ncbi:MAG: DUF4129 domain-containing protein [Prevotella sp.]|nr:DUF4129 domain-containing protein [Prevotella sp.]
MQYLELQVMQNDSLVRQLLRDYNYNRGLVEDKYLDADPWVSNSYDSAHGDSVAEAIGKFFDALASFLHDVPVVVWVILGVFVLSLVLYGLLRSGLFSFYKQQAEPSFAPEDNIYEIDYDDEMASALREGNWPAVVRLVYLSTLRRLDECGAVVWRIYKTPSQFAAEVDDTAFTQMTNHFLRVRYGGFPASKEMCDEMTLLSNQVRKGGDR